MKLIVPRTCTEIRNANTIVDVGRTKANPGRSLESYRAIPAYVLLGDPGAGKTTAFTSECAALGDAACYVTARDFLTFSPDDHPEWRGKTLLIDGLDERRAGSPDKLTPFDRIRSHLDKLGKPRFRLSCRTADWLGENDRRHLAAVTRQNFEPNVLRLDPLTDSDARKILEARTDIPDASTFIAAAKERGVDALLKNPQSLRLLADVVASGDAWPESRLKTFEQACRHLAAEHNQGRRYVAQAPDVNCTLDAAGRMCAILLLTGCAGYARDPDDADDDYLNPDRCAYDLDRCLHALSTKLFTAETDGRFTPVHRHVAEFLTARHCKRLNAERRLPARRVPALIAGEDGTVVTEHRGLSAWLAALCPEVRLDLIERDPIGVVSYGDVRDFTTEEKRTLLFALSQEDSRLHSATWTREAVGALATQDMESILRDALKSPSEEPYFGALVLLALTHGTPLTGLADFLFDMVYQPHRWAQIPGMVLDAFLHNCPDDTSKNQRLRKLLSDLKLEQVPDWNNELLGTILTELYPHLLAPAEIWDYLSVTAQRFVAGPYHHFWHCHLVESSSDIAELLDSLTAQRKQLKPALESHHLQGVPLKLLARGLEKYGDSLDIERLCDWLTVDMFPELHGMAIEAVQRIRSWLEQRPDTLEAVIAEVAGRPIEPMSTAQSQVDLIRYGADFSPDYGLWCLQQAPASTDPVWSRHFLYSCCRSLAYQSHDRGLTLELLFELTQGSANLRHLLKDMLVCRIEKAYPIGLREKRRYREEREHNHSSWIAYVRSIVDELRSGQCALDVLYLIGKAYFGALIEARGASSEERIGELFRHEEPLVAAARSGLRCTLNRTDIPDPEEIINLTASGQVDRRGLPFLAGMEEISPEAVHQLSARRVTQALSFHYCHYRAPAPSIQNQGSGWYRILLNRYPVTVADVLVRCIAAVLRSGQHDDSIVHQLVMEDHADVARHAAMRLLRGFPLRCTVPQLLILDPLLHAAHRYADRPSFLELIAERHSLPSMTVAQRVHWLAMGVIVCPQTYLDRIKEFVQRREQRISHLAEFLLRAGPTIDELTVPALKYYVSLLGSTVGRWVWHDSEIETTASSSVSSCVYEMIQRLAGLPEREASIALEALASDTALSSWHSNVIPARDRQRVVRRDAVYRHPGVDQVCNTLHDGPPANSADLAALVTDRLHEIAVCIRTGNTDDWQQYWNVDQYGHALAPKPENSCRNALLSDLLQRLPSAVEAAREVQHANSTRADIQISYQGAHIPVEAKRNDHQDLWTAIRSQLIVRYVSEPATGGYGIYLVFWFGTEHTPRSPAGVRPASADELRVQLEAMLSTEERRKISACVIDVSAPPR